MPQVKLVLAYDGSRFRGSQIQSGVPTVQGEVERGLRTIGAYKRSSTFAGRTDAGVHAVGQVVSADVHWDRGAGRLNSALNAVTSSDIKVMATSFVDATFHARFDARFREYRYRVASGGSVPPMVERYVWPLTGEIDDALAAGAAAAFAGRHSFGSFASAGRSRSLDQTDLVREVLLCRWRQISCGVFNVDGSSVIGELQIVASGFLPQMARNMARAVVDVATGKMPLNWIEFLLVSGDRSLLGAPAPPHGLVLWRVGYEDEQVVASGSME